MAKVTNRKSDAVRRRPVAARRAIQAAAPVESPRPAPAPSRPPARLWIVPVVMAAVLALVAVFLVWHARYLASLKFDMVRDAPRIVPQGHGPGETTDLAAISGDPEGDTFTLESQPGLPVRLVRFDPQESADSMEYKAHGRGQDLTGAEDVDCDSRGFVYVLLADGRIQVLGNRLGFLRTIQTGLPNSTGLSVDSKGRIFVADEPENKVVVFDNSGHRLGDFGSSGDDPALVSPTFIRVAKDDEIVVCERTATGLRGRVFTPDFKLRRTFLVDKLASSPPVRMGVNGQLKAFFNDAAGSSGIDCWDLRTGRFFGSAQVTTDGVQFINPGCIGADRFTDDVYVHTVVGLVRCRLPRPGESR